MRDVRLSRVEPSLQVLLRFQRGLQRHTCAVQLGRPLPVSRVRLAQLGFEPAALRAHLLHPRQAELAQTRVERAAALKQVKQATAERQRLEKQLGEAADQQRLHVLLDLAGQQHQDLRARLQDAELQCRERQVHLDQTLAAHRALLARAQALDAAQQEALSSHSAERARLDALVAAAEAARDKHAEAAVNREVVLNALAEHSRRLTPLVTTGRLARELAPQLRELVERVDGLANQMLEDCHLDRAGRADLELLRAEVVRAGALASELLIASTESDLARVIIDRRGGRTEGRS